MTTASIRHTRRLGAASAAAALIALVATGAAFAGNNGTLKIHEAGTPDGTPNNDPKVCTFNVEAFNLDPGQTGYLVFEVQGGDAPHGGELGPIQRTGQCGRLPGLEILQPARRSLQGHALRQG